MRSSYASVGSCPVRSAIPRPVRASRTARIRSHRHPSGAILVPGQRRRARRRLDEVRHDSATDRTGALAQGRMIHEQATDQPCPEQARNSTTRRSGHLSGMTKRVDDRSALLRRAAGDAAFGGCAASGRVLSSSSRAACTSPSLRRSPAGALRRGATTRLGRHLAYGLAPAAPFAPRMSSTHRPACTTTTRMYVAIQQA